MSTKGTSLTTTTKHRISQAKTTTTKKHLIKSGKEYLSYLEDNPTTTPTLAGYCLKAGIFQSNLIDYRAKWTEVDQLCEFIETLQEDFAIQTGMTTKNGNFAKFLLQSKHKYQDTPTQLTQNNSFNITPDILQDALSLMDKDK